MHGLSKSLVPFPGLDNIVGIVSAGRERSNRNGTRLWGCDNRNKWVYTYTLYTQLESLFVP